MMHFNQLSTKKLDEIKPQASKLANKLLALGIPVRQYAGSHYNWYLIASLLHWELCLLDNTNLKVWLTHNQCQVLLLQLQAIKNLLMSVETSLGHHLVTQFLENEKAATIDNVIREYAEGADS